MNSCGTPSIAEGMALDADSCNLLEMELSNTKFEKIKKFMNKGKYVISSKHVINQNINTSLHEGSKTK